MLYTTKSSVLKGNLRNQVVETFRNQPLYFERLRHVLGRSWSGLEERVVMSVLRGVLVNGSQGGGLFSLSFDPPRARRSNLVGLFCPFMGSRPGPPIREELI